MYNVHELVGLPGVAQSVGPQKGSIPQLKAVPAVERVGNSGKRLTMEAGNQLSMAKKGRRRRSIHPVQKLTHVIMET